MLVLSLILFKISKTRWKQVGSIFKFIMFFLVINVLAIFIFAPDQGTKIYGTQHVLFQLSEHYPITAEQLFYELNIILKYFTIIPAVFIFVVTTNPSEFAASLNRIRNQLQHRLCGGACDHIPQWQPVLQSVCIENLKIIETNSKIFGTYS